MAASHAMPASAAASHSAPALLPCARTGLQKVRLRDYVHHIAGSPTVAVLLGRRVALVIDDSAETRAELPVDAIFDGPLTPACASVISMLEQLMQLFDDCVRAPPVPGHLYGRTRVEVMNLNHAAGLAHHGVGGIAVGPSLFLSCVEAHSRGERVLEHVFGYELCRNYIFPSEFTPVFDYRLVEGPACWGWVNQGFVNVLGCLLSGEMPGVTFHYYGRDREGFMRSMEEHVFKYMDDARLGWDAVFMHERLPWDAHTSLDNVYSGILVMLYRTYGPRALRGWFRSIPLLLQRCPASKEDVATARDNFYLAASVAAGQDLAPWFQSKLKWPISDAVRHGTVDALLAALQG